MLAASVVDVAGINSISARILANAAAAMAGMVAGARRSSWGRAGRCRRLDVRRHDAVRHARGRGARRPRLRGADVPHDRHRRALDGGADRRRLHRRRARHDDDGAVRRARRRRARRRARPPHRRRPRGRAAGRLAGRPRHGQLRPARDGSRAVRRAQPVRPQRAGDAHAHDAGGVRAARRGGRAQALGRHRARRAVRAARRHLDDRDAGRPVLRRRGRRGAVRGRARQRRRRTSSSIELDTDINDPAFADAMVAKLHSYLGGAA